MEKFKCPWPTCEKLFDSERGLSQHRRRQTHFDEKFPLTAEIEKVTVPLPEGAQPVAQTETVVTSESSLPTKRLRKRKLNLDYDYNEEGDGAEKEDDGSYQSGDEEDERPKKKQKTPNKRQSSGGLPKSPAPAGLLNSPSSIVAQPRSPLPGASMQQQQMMQQTQQQQQQRFAGQHAPAAQQPGMSHMYQMPPMMNAMPAAQQYHQMSGYHMGGQYAMPPHMQQTGYMPTYQPMMAQQYMQHPQYQQQMQQMSQMSQMSQHVPQMQQMSQQLPPMSAHMSQQTNQQRQQHVDASLSPLDFLSNHASKSNYANGGHNGDAHSSGSMNGDEHKEHLKAHQEAHAHEQQKHLIQNIDGVHHDHGQAVQQHLSDHQLGAEAPQQQVVEAGDNKKKMEVAKAKSKPEKRLARFRSNPTQAIRDRIHRAEQQRMYLIDRDPPTNPHAQKFYVLGSVGNVYTVTIAHLPACTCPDFAKGNLCKHILFVFLKVLRVPSNSNLIYQNALLTDELESIFTNAPSKPTAVMASKNVRDTFDKVMGKTPEKKEKDATEDDGDVKRKPIEDAMCPICYEDLKPNEKLVWCKTSCGQNLHEECFNQWKTQAKSSRREVTCVYCRAEWPEEVTIKGNTKAKGAKMNEGYVNLASLQPGVSRVRDTSSYNSYWYD